MSDVETENTKWVMKIQRKVWKTCYFHTSSNLKFGAKKGVKWFVCTVTNPYHCHITCTLTSWHRSFTFNSNKSPTWCNNFSLYYPDVFYSSTCFGRFPAHHQELNDCSGSLWFYLRIVVTVVLCSWSGRPARPRTQYRKKNIQISDKLSSKRLNFTEYEMTKKMVLRKNWKKLLWN